MPWSPWQDSEPYDVGAARLAVRFRHDRLTGTLVTEGANTSADSAGVTREVISNPGNDVDNDNRDGMQYSEPAGWESERDWFPAPLYALEEGVDFGVRPDRAAGDDDAYVEYEDGSSVRTDWIISGAPKVTLNQGYPAGGISFIWSLGVRAGTAYTLGTGNPPGFPGVGAVFATADQSTPTGAILSAVPAMGQATSFLISASLDSASLSDDFQVYASASLPRPFMRVTQPHWRYWIPGPSEPLPLRQRQRDDNLALGVGRWRRGTSRQRSIRWAGYL